MLVWLKRIVIIAIVLVAGLLGTVYALFGRGQPYPDVSGPPRLPESALEVAVTSPRPIGNVAVSTTGRIFYTIHPESNPVGTKLYEWVAGQPVPYPNETDQASLFDTPLGVNVDQQNRLWVIDPGMHGTGQPRLIAFDLNTNQVVERFDFPSEIAPIGSFLQAMQVSKDGASVYIADVGFWAKRPALIVYDVKAKQARRLLNRHASVYPQNILIRNQIRDMSFFGGILEMKTGIDGLALSRDDQWLYYAAMNHDTLFRIPTSALQDKALDEAALASRIEAVGKKPLNDGLSIDEQGTVYITDVEHQAVLAMAPDGKLSTVIKDKRIRWADSLSFGPDEWLYLADSAIPELVLQNAAHHEAKAPYFVWRFRPGGTAAAGQ